MATLYKTDGTQEEVRPANGRHFTVEELQGYVGGDFEIITLDFGSRKKGYLVFDDDGIRKNKPENLQATRVFAGYAFPLIPVTILGDALLTDTREVY